MSPLVLFAAGIGMGMEKDTKLSSQGKNLLSFSPQEKVELISTFFCRLEGK